MSQQTQPATLPVACKMGHEDTCGTWHILLRRLLLLPLLLVAAASTALAAATVVVVGGRRRAALRPKTSLLLSSLLLGHRRGVRRALAEREPAVGLGVVSLVPSGQVTRLTSCVKALPATAPLGSLWRGLVRGLGAAADDDDATGAGVGAGFSPALTPPRDQPAGTVGTWVSRSAAVGVYALMPDPGDSMAGADSWAW